MDQKEIENDQLMNQLEQRYIALKKEFDAVSNERNSIKTKVVALESNIEELRSHVSITEKKNNENEIELKQKEIMVKELSQINEDLNDRLKRGAEEKDRLRDEIRSQSNEMIQLQNRLKETQIKFSESESKLHPIEFELSKEKHEKELLQDQVSYLEEQIKSKSNDERKLKYETDEKIFSLEKELNENKLSLEEKDPYIQNLKSEIEIQQEKTDNFMKKFSDAEKQVIELQSSFSKELEGHKNLSELYKRYFDEAVAKVEELENLNDSLKVSIDKNVSSASEASRVHIEKIEAQHKMEIEKYLAKIADLEEKLKNPTTEASLNVVETDSNRSKFIESIQGLGATEMYDQIVKMEDELLRERNKRREAEIYLNQILKDVESKAPVIASQRRDYHRVVESHSNLSHRLDLVLDENSRLSSENTKISEQLRYFKHEVETLEQHNHDLSSQIQNLLKTSLKQELGQQDQLQFEEVLENSEEFNHSDLISNYLVKYNNIDELQQQNQHLLKLVRDLSNSASDRERQIAEGPTSSESEALKKAEEELEKLKESRKRTEDMVSILIQQRDMYKSMVENDYENRFILNSPSKSSQQHLLTTTSIPVDQSQLDDLKKKLEQIEEEKKRLNERLVRFEEAEKVLHDSIDNLRKEATSARMEYAQAANESRFYKERADRLESSLKTAQQESNLAMQKRMEIERTTFEFQKELRLKDDKVFQITEDLRIAQDKLRKAEMNAEISKASEKRVVEQLAEAREEIKRHAQLAEHLNKIETGLQSRANEERESLQIENDSLSKTVESLRRQLEEKELIDEQKLRTLEEDIKTVRNKLDLKTTELASLREDLVRQQSTAQAAQERSKLLEKQLENTQERLSSIKGSQIGDMMSYKDLSEKEVELEKALSEIQSLKEQLAASESHVQQFRKLSSSNELALKDIETRANESNGLLQKEIEALRSKIESLNSELTSQKSSTGGLVSELEEARDHLRKATSDHQDNLKSMQEKLNLAQQENEQLKKQIESLEADISNHQKSAEQSYANYERELQMHAQAEKDLRSLRSENDKSKQTIATLHDQISSLSAESIRKEKIISEANSKYQGEIDLLKENISNLQKTNDLLHAQVQSYGIQIEKMHEMRLEILNEKETRATKTTEATDSTSSTNQQGDDASQSASHDESKDEKQKEAGTETISQVDSTAPTNLQDQQPMARLPLSSPEKVYLDELKELRKSASEMREVLSYMKKEKDMLQARLLVVETENNRHLSELNSANRTLDELRTDLKIQLEKKASSRTEDEFNKLMSQVNQLNLLRESNAHLRAENESFNKKLSEMSSELQTARDAIAPLEEKIRKLEADKEALELVNDQVTNDVEYWKSRLHTLVTRYNDVDPEEHRLIKAQLDEVSSELTNSKTEFDKKIAEKESLIAQKDKNSETLRERLRLFKEKKEELEVKLQEIVKQTSTKDSNISSLTQNLTEANTKISNLNTTVSRLKLRVQQLQQQQQQTKASQNQLQNQSQSQGQHSTQVTKSNQPSPQQPSEQQHQQQSSVGQLNQQVDASVSDNESQIVEVAPVQGSSGEAEQLLLGKKRDRQETEIESSAITSSIAVETAENDSKVSTSTPSATAATLKDSTRQAKIKQSLLAKKLGEIKNKKANASASANQSSTASTSLTTATAASKSQDQSVQQSLPTPSQSQEEPNIQRKKAKLNEDSSIDSSETSVKTSAQIKDPSSNTKPSESSVESVSTSTTANQAAPKISGSPFQSHPPVTTSSSSQETKPIQSFFMNSQPNTSNIKPPPPKDAPKPNLNPPPPKDAPKQNLNPPPPSTAPPASSIFGKALGSATSFSSFGNNNLQTTTTTTKSIFGSSPFGSSSNTSSIFGSNTLSSSTSGSTTNLFGSKLEGEKKNTSGQTSIFGGSAQASTSGNQISNSPFSVVNIKPQAIDENKRKELRAARFGQSQVLTPAQITKTSSAKTNASAEEQGEELEDLEPMGEDNEKFEQNFNDIGEENNLESS